MTMNIATKHKYIDDVVVIVVATIQQERECYLNNTYKEKLSSISPFLGFSLCGIDIVLSCRVDIPKSIIGLLHIKTTGNIYNYLDGLVFGGGGLVCGIRADRLKRND
ncbi:hypothetical protein PPL_07530 [Heterostelium album PN500]|uniref:Uncharacterized protein n=1 Tax=Heterostelium pallidum (strain ATCC 26659 / Pp 5 / PN500) TaxID=670386 RepID=D3BG79_HETP5|nr:hypothetical protein PPL_07530 [Heterostelium album PN500]EFA79479.1 hypothetical protein PPL_07530 [Heterostelium album PN500]|eukprot:XP_020431600.1 hypothetical protein PPL_07530 [Heterostelium album PN500]